MGNNNKFEAITSSNVTFDSLVSKFGNMGYDFTTVNHIAATNTLKEAFRSKDVLSHSIAQIIDMVVAPMSSWDNNVSLGTLPAASDFNINPNSYKKGYSNWQRFIKSARYANATRFAQRVRDAAELWGLDQKIRPQIEDGALELFKSLLKVTQDGLSYSQFSKLEQSNSITGVQKSTLRIWREFEADFQILTIYRDCLWIEEQEYINQSTVFAKELRSNIYEALDVAFGPVEGRRIIAHHGFYFYTPSQWAFFQLLKWTPGIDQYFLVNDDGLSPTSRIWREFFLETLNMPAVVPQKEMSVARTSKSRVFRDLISGNRIPEDERVSDLVLVNYANSSEFSRAIGAYMEEVEPGDAAIFAPRSEALEPYINRFLTPSERNQTNVIQLPAGIFLTSLHSCFANGPRTQEDITVKPEIFERLLSSAFSMSSNEKYKTVLSLYPLVRRFFGTCESISQWREAALSLEELISVQIPRMAPDGIERPTDKEGLKPSSILGLVPWASLDRSEVNAIRELVFEIMDLIENTFSAERITFGDSIVATQLFLERRLASASQAVQLLIDDLLPDIQNVDTGEIDARGIANLVQQLMHKDIDFDEYDDSPNLPLRNSQALDALGFSPRSLPTILTNLSEGNFPTQNEPLPWPFTNEMLKMAHLEASPIGIIYDARRRCSSLEDLYLFDLALNGVDEGSKLVLSWITRVESEDTLPSTFINVFSKVSKVSAGTQSYLGGFVVEQSSQQIEVNHNPLAVTLVEGELNGIEASLISQNNQVAFSAALACPRRFSLQWQMSDNFSYRTPHMQEILYGNLFHLLPRFTAGVEGEFLDRLFPFLSEAARVSSRSKARFGNTQPPRPVWIFGLSGTAEANLPLPLDRAYNHALGRISGAVSDELKTWKALPNPELSDQTQVAICNKCPVSDMCLVRVSEAES
jgi:hypothetical protein